MVKVIQFGKYDIACGACGSVLLGWDESTCVCCGAENDMDNPIQMSEDEVIALNKASSLV